MRRDLLLVVPLLASGLSALRGLGASPGPVPSPPVPEPQPSRRIALRMATDAYGSEDLARFAAAARRRGVLLQAGPESEAVPAGWEVLRVAVTPVSAAFAARLRRLPVTPLPDGFTFDGRTYRAEDDALAVSTAEAPTERVVLANSARAARRLSGSILWSGPLPHASYRLVSGELRKEGRFLSTADGSRVDRKADRDEIAERDRFFRELQSERGGGVTWRFAPATRAAAARYRQVFERHGGPGPGDPPGAVYLTVTVFPDTMTKARYTGSSRPADIVRDGAGGRLDLDASAPEAPDLASPALAAAAAACRAPTLLGRPLMLLAEGARRHGRWWGREVASFAAFTRRAGVAPSVAEVLAAGEDLSPVLAVGTAAAWLHAGAATRPPAQLLALLSGPQPRLAGELELWSQRAAAIPVPAPPRRPLPAGFLRGVSYAMTNRLESSYASPRSRETLDRLAALSVNSVSIMPFGFSATAREASIRFLHLHPAGETDEGTVLAVGHARRLGMTSMLKPQLWLGGGGFVGEIAMPNDAAWRSWFADYRRFLVHNAVVAEASRADLFCVGTELVKSETREKEWRDAIAAVRLATGAPLLYASNWAAGAVRVPFWDALDAIGADFYDPLSADPAASDAALREGARRAFAPLAALARRHRKPVIFAEAGYPPARSAWLAPHEENSGRPYAPEDAARAIAAVFAALEREPAWRGVYWWKVFTEGRPAAPGAHDFNLLGRPAERVIAEAFARRAAREGN